MISNSDILCHYGILGMKWGVRRTPEQLGHDRTIKAGTKFYRQTTNPNESKIGSKYVSYADPDRDYYKGRAKNFILYNSKKKKNSNSNDIYEVQYKAVENIVAPSIKATVAGIKAVNKQYPKQSIAAMQKCAVYTKGHRYVTKYLNDWREKHFLSDYGTFEDYNNAMYEYAKSIKPKADKECMRDFANDYKNNKFNDNDLLYYSVMAVDFDSKYRTLIEDHFKKQGYNAVTDLAGIGVDAREGYDPLIVLNTESTLIKLSTHKVSEIESNKAVTEYNKWLEKNREYGLTNVLNVNKD